MREGMVDKQQNVLEWQLLLKNEIKPNWEEEFKDAIPSILKTRDKNYSEDQYCKNRKKIYFYFNYVDRLTFGYE